MTNTVVVEVEETPTPTNINKREKMAVETKDLSIKRKQILNICKVVVV